MIDLLRAIPIRLQVALLLAAAPLVVAVLGLTLAPLAVEQAMAGADPRGIATVADAVRIAIAAVALCGLVAAAGAAAVLRGSIAALVGRMQEATDALAAGRFRHRIASRRSDELGGLAHAIDRMAARLERLEAARRQLLASVSHELRTPLTIIRGHAFTLARHEPDAARRSRFELIDREVVRLTHLVEELVDAASLQAGGIALERRGCDLDELVREAACGFGVEAAERGVRLDVDVRTRRYAAWVDQRRIRQVLDNLIANAVRHADADSSVRIAASWDGRAGAHRVEVRNTGAAIDPADRERIFEPFVQASSRPGRIGLGLPIARSLVEAHGGCLQLADTGPVGEVAFVVSIPAARNDTRGAAGSHAGGGARRAARRIVRPLRPPAPAEAQ